MRTKSYTHFSNGINCVSKDIIKIHNDSNYYWFIDKPICLLDEYNKMAPDYKEALDKCMLINSFSTHDYMRRMKINAKIEIAKSLMAFNNWRAL